MQEATEKHCCLDTSESDAATSLRHGFPLFRALSPIGVRKADEVHEHETNEPRESGKDVSHRTFVRHEEQRADDAEKDDVRYEDHAYPEQGTDRASRHLLSMVVLPDTRSAQPTGHRLQVGV